MLALKLLLTPTLILAASLAQKRWGSRASGYLVGLPLTGAPVTLFLALEQGTQFAAQSAISTLLGLISLCAFGLTYAWMAIRAPWLISSLVGIVTFLAATILFHRLELTAVMAFLLVVVAIAGSQRYLPPASLAGATPGLSNWEMVFRMLVATAMVVVLTGWASLLGPRLAGLLVPFPVYAGILAAFTHRNHGAISAVNFLSGVIGGSYGYALFCLAVGSLIIPAGILTAFVVACILSVGACGPIAVYFFRKRWF